MSLVEFLDPELVGEDEIEVDPCLAVGWRIGSDVGGAVEFWHCGKIVLSYGQPLTDAEIDHTLNKIERAAKREMRYATYH